MKNHWNRRRFLGTSAAIGTGVSFGLSKGFGAEAKTAIGKPAILGGDKAHRGSFPSWPKFDEREEQLSCKPSAPENGDG